MKILIAVPTFESIFPDTFKAIYDLDTTGHEVDFEYVRGYDCAKARNVIAGMAIDKGMDFVMMVDNDVVLPKDALQNLVEGQKDVVMGYCPRRSKDNEKITTICKLRDENGKEYVHYKTESRYSGEEIVKLREDGQNQVRIHGGGTACILIKTDVFKRLKHPWFKWVQYDRERQLSEDLYFCEQCKKAKIPIYLDTRVSCGHIFRYVQYAD